MTKLLLSQIFSFLFFVSVSHGATVSGAHFDRVIFVIFENTNYADAIKQSFFKQLADDGANFTGFSAETHPSQGNYVALTSGSLNGVRGDGKIDLNVNHVGDLLEAKGVTWKVYVEDYPGGCFTGGSSGDYARKHNPFISYLNIQKDARRCSNIVNSNEFDQDVLNGTLPQYVFFVPNQKNDGHDTGVKFADTWYRQRFENYFRDVRFMEKTLVISTFDESAGARGNQIYASFTGPMVATHSIVNGQLNHYSLLKLVEENWNLGSLGKEDDRAGSIGGIWK